MGFFDSIASAATAPFSTVADTFENLTSGHPGKALDSFAGLTPWNQIIQNTPLKNSSVVNQVNNLVSFRNQMNPFSPAAAAASKIKENKTLGRAYDVVREGYKAYVTGGTSLLQQGNAEKIGTPLGQQFDETSGGKAKRDAANASAQAQAASQNQQLADLNQQKQQQTALSAGIAEQTAARRQQLNQIATRRRSTILTGPLGIQSGGNSVGGVQGYGTLLGGGS